MRHFAIQAVIQRFRNYTGSAAKSMFHSTGPCTPAWVLAFLLALTVHTTRAVDVFNQPHNGSGTIHRSCWMDPDGSNWGEFAWDSFQLAGSAAITEIRWRGGFDPAYNNSGGPVFDFQVAFVANNGGLWEPDVVNPPLADYMAGGNCGQTPAGSYGGTALYDYHYTLPSPFQAAAGTRYWIYILAYQNGVHDWGFAAAAGGNGSHLRKLSEYMYQSVPRDFTYSLQTSEAPSATISASVLPASTGAVFGAGVYPIGSTATLTATPEPGFGFDVWTEGGNPVGSASQYSFVVDGDHSLVAHFVPAWTITTDSWPPMGGTATGGGLYNAGTSVTVHAVSAPGLLLRRLA